MNDDERVGAFLRKVPPPADFPADRLWRVRRRLAETTRPQTGQTAQSGRRPRARAIGWVLAAVSLLVGGGVVGAARGWLPQWPLLGAQRAEAPATATTNKRPRPSARPAAPSSPTFEPPPPPSAPAALPPVQAPRGKRPPAVFAAPPASENAVLERAVVLLRQKRDPTQALLLLDDYDARFPTGVLAEEAARLRVDALLLAQRSGRALKQLNALVLSDGARDVELGLIRGELRAAARDCARAIADFDRVLLLSPDPALRRRAQAGRAGCGGGGSSSTIELP